MARRLDLIAGEVAAEGDLPSDRAEAADYVARQMRLERPDATARAIQRAAAAAVGAPPPPTKAETDAMLADADRRSLSGRARAGGRAAAGRGRAGGRRVARAGRRLRRRPEFSNPLRGASSAVGVVAQVFGLTVLYWLLRTPEAIDTLTAGASRLFAWVASPGGVGAPAATTIGGVLADPDRDPGARVNVAPGGLDNLGPGGAGSTAQVERWRPLVARYFPAHAVNKAMDVLACESEGNPAARNPTSGAAGLFQHIPRYFDARAAAAGFPGASPFDPEANVAAAAWLWRREGWSPWECA